MSKKFWDFRNEADGSGAELLLYGDISDSSWWGDEVTPKQFADDLKKLGDVDAITVRINSGGGDVFAAQAIGNQLEQHSAEVTAKIDGLCASAATIVACHCDKVVAANDGIYMVHPVKIGMYGYKDEKELKQYLGALETIKESILSLYVKKTGCTKDEAEAWVDATSWWTAEEAKEKGFVDELVEEPEETGVENRNGFLFVNNVNTNLPFKETPEFVQNCQTAQTAGQFVNKGKPGKPEKKKEETKMEIKTVDELRKEYPDLVAELEKAAAENAAKEERERIKNIEDMTITGNEDKARDAKFTNPVSAEDYAVAVVKEAKNKGANYLKGIKDDAETGGANGMRQEPAGGEGADEFLNAIKGFGKSKEAGR